MSDTTTTQANTYNNAERLTTPEQSESQISAPVSPRELDKAFNYDIQTITQCAEAIAKLLEKMSADLPSFRNLLFSTFALIFAIPLSPITPQIAKLRWEGISRFFPLPGALILILWLV